MKNDYEIRGHVTAIFLRSRKYGAMETLIATVDLPRAMEFPTTWCVQWNKATRSFYVAGRTPSTQGNKTVYMHRWILRVYNRNTHVDHVLHDTLDNCRWALNAVTPSENHQNRRLGYSNKSGTHGVSWFKSSKKWRADIQVDGRIKYLGLFDDINDAIAARKDAELRYFTYKQSIS